MTEPRTLGDRYEIGPLLGYGGMAEVHRGRDNRLDRDVAVKVLRSDLARDPTFQARFRREAQAAAALNHPAIVAVYDTGDDHTDTDKSTPYIVMEYVEGQTLRDLLKSERVLEPTQAMQITAEICAALDFSHRSGIVHRDVKPGNVMMTTSGRVKVMDFGIARAVSDSAATMTATAAVIGTAQYLSPEQARGENVDARSDVYAAGCVLYELVTGAPPFVGDSPVAVAYQHVRENAKPPSQVNPQVPSSVDAIVMKAMSKNPANRYQSAAEMQQDLLRAVDGRAVEATPVLSEEEATQLIGAVPPPALSSRSLPRHSHPLDDVDDDEPDARKKRGWIYGGLAALVALILIGAFILIPKLTAKEEVPPVAVPSLVNLTAADAKVELEKAGLVLGEQTTGPSTVEMKDKVIGQNPAAESSLEKGQPVDLVIGAGPNQVTIPQLVGLDKEAATTALSGVGLKANFVPQDNKIDANKVIDSSPKSGEAVPESTTVTVFVSTGTLALPDVTGKEAAVAKEQLVAAGYANVTIAEEETTAALPGVVIKQDPKAGKVDPDNTITLTVAKEPPPKNLPDVTGQEQTVAKEQLAAAGYTKVTVVEEESATVAPGVVIKQDPQPGEVDPATTITLTVAKAPPTTEPEPPPGDGDGDGDGDGG